MCMRWRIGVHGRGSDGETGVCLTQLQNIASWTQYKWYHLTHTPQLQVIDWPVTPAKLHGLFHFTERWNLVFVCVHHLGHCSIHCVIWGVFFNFTCNLGAHILYDLYFFRYTSTMKNLLQGKLQLQH